MKEDERGCCLVCGSDVAPGEGIRESYEGTRCVFCSPGCQAKFEADPERYLGETQCLVQPPGYW